jgi:hypothetical protein
MPYSVRKEKNGKWVKIKKDTGKVVSHHDTKEKAEASIRAYYANKGKGKRKPSKKLKNESVYKKLVSHLNLL